MSNHLVLNHDVLVASGFASLHETHLFLLGSALVETEVVVHVNHILNALLDRVELLLIESLFRVHLFIKL
jgi:hypothetical protein